MLTVSTREELAKAMIDKIAEMEITGEAYRAFKEEKKYFLATLIYGSMALLMYLIAYLNREGTLLLQIIIYSVMFLFLIPAVVCGRGRCCSKDAVLRVLVQGCLRYRIVSDSSDHATIVLKKIK